MREQLNEPAKQAAELGRGRAKLNEVKLNAALGSAGRRPPSPL